jgi:hypothetical protein
VDSFQIEEFCRKRNYILQKACICIVATMPDLNEIHVLLDGLVAAPMFQVCSPLPLDFRMLPGNRQKVRRLSADAVACQVGPQAEGKNSPFDFSAKNNRNVGISMLQGQQI